MENEYIQEPHRQDPCRTSPSSPQQTNRPGLFRSCMTMLGFGCFITLIILTALVIFSFKSCKSLIETMPDSGSDMEETFLFGDPDSKDIVAVLDVKGVITSDSTDFESTCSAEEICSLIRQLKEDDAIRAIVLRLDTPGGEVTASDVIYHELKNCGKPVVAYMNSMAASGGYYIAMSAKKIVAHRMTMTGSIGVIMHAFNCSSLMNFIGLEEEVYASGKMKDMLSGTRKRTSEEKEIANTLVRNTYEDFVKIVSQARGIPEKTIMETEIGDGRILDGQQALAAKLVDRLGYFEDAVAEAEELASLDKGSAQVVLFQGKSNLLAALSRFIGTVRNPVVALPGTREKRAFRAEQGKPYFLPAGY